MSVPNQNSPEGCLRRLTGATACGSTVPSHGASAATRIMAASTTPPTMAVGWRHSASLKRPRTGDPDDGAARAAVAMSVSDARVEEHVREIDREVDEDVGPREDQDDALDDRVVAAQDRVHREAADARDREHGFGDD